MAWMDNINHIRMSCNIRQKFFEGHASCPDFCRICCEWLITQSDLLLSERLAQACPQKEIQTSKQGKAYVYSHVCLYIRMYIRM